MVPWEIADCGTITVWNPSAVRKEFKNVWKVFHILRTFCIYFQCPLQRSLVFERFKNIYTCPLLWCFSNRKKWKWQVGTETLPTMGDPYYQTAPNVCAFLKRTKKKHPYRNLSKTVVYLFVFIYKKPNFSLWCTQPIFLSVCNFSRTTVW